MTVRFGAQAPTDPFLPEAPPPTARYRPQADAESAQKVAIPSPGSGPICMRFVSLSEVGFAEEVPLRFT